jgi:hypothetical protein
LKNWDPIIGDYVAYLQQARAECDDPAVFGKVVRALLREFCDHIITEGKHYARKL